MSAGKEKLDSLKNFVNGKRKNNKDAKIEIIFTDGMDEYRIQDVKQIPDYSILESEIFFDSPFIQYDFFIDDKKIKTGFIKEKENSVPVVQRAQNQISNFDQLAEILNIKKIMDQEVLAQQNKITEGRLEAIKSAFETKVENVQQGFNDRLRFQEEIYNERLKLREEQLKLEYKTPRRNRDSAFSDLAIEFIKNVSPEAKDNFLNLVTGLGLGIVKKYLPETELTGLTPAE